MQGRREVTRSRLQSSSCHSSKSNSTLDPTEPMMTVQCEGDCPLIDQTGEKQDFEVALTRFRLPHEDFALQVVRVPGTFGSWDWGLRYRVTVRHVPSDRTLMYLATPSRS